MKKPFRLAALLALLVLSAPCAGAKEIDRPEALDFPAETFSFSNDTVLAYGTDEGGEFYARWKKDPPDFTHRCFLLARATLQFHKFARFEPDAPNVSDAEYFELIRQISRIDVWLPKRPPHERIVIPGYPNLYAFTQGRKMMFKHALGSWVLSYLRVGNHRIMMPMPRSGQERLSRWLTRRLDRGEPSALFLVRFPRMNHVVIAYSYEREASGDIRFIAYDPNYPDEPTSLWYRAAERSFDFEKRWYFPGGRVNALRVYISPLH